MRAVWGAYESSSFQGRSNASFVRMMNALKRELKTAQDALLMDHQQEDVVSGGNAESIQFHYLLVPDTSTASATTVIPDAQVFDANQGATGTAGTYFAPRRDFRKPGRGF